MQELRETLQQADTQRVIAHFINSTESLGFSKADEEEYDEDEESVATPREERLSFIPHAADAVDYSDFNEAVPDQPNEDRIFSDHYYRRGVGVVKQMQSKVLESRSKLTDDDYDEVMDNNEAKVKQELDTLRSPVEVGRAGFPAPAPQILRSQYIEAVLPGRVAMFIGPDIVTVSEPMPPQPPDVKALYPAFEKDKILKFSELFSKKLQRPPALHAKGKRGLFNLGILVVRCAFALRWRYCATKHASLDA